MRLRGQDLTELPKENTLYLKKWQANGYYPICRAVRVYEDEWHVWSQKGGEWSRTFLVFNDENFLYILRNNNYLVSDTQMCNTDEFNFE